MRPEVDEGVESMVLRSPARPQPRSHPGLVQLQRARPHLPVRHTLAVREVGLHDAQPLRPVQLVVKMEHFDDINAKCFTITKTGRIKTVRHCANELGRVEIFSVKLQFFSKLCKGSFAAVENIKSHLNTSLMICLCTGLRWAL